MDYKIGDKVVYPNHGVGVVEQIQLRSLERQNRTLLMIRIVSSGLRVMVPQSNALTVGLRSVIVPRNPPKSWASSKKANSTLITTGSTASKRNSSACAPGPFLEVAVVLKSLVSLSRSKPLSFREKKMLERAKYLLVSEMATSRNTTAENAEATVVKSLAKAKLQFPVLTEKFDSFPVGAQACCAPFEQAFQSTGGQHQVARLFLSMPFTSFLRVLRVSAFNSFFSVRSVSSAVSVVNSSSFP